MITTHLNVTLSFPEKIFTSSPGHAVCMAIFNIKGLMKLILLGVVMENRLTTQIELLYLKLALCYVATKAGNVQCNKDFKTAWNSQTESIWNQLERGDNTGSCKSSVVSQLEKPKLEKQKSFYISVVFQMMPQTFSNQNTWQWHQTARPSLAPRPVNIQWIWKRKHALNFIHEYWSPT